MVSYDEGIAWLPINSERAIFAWRETLLREMDNMDSTFDRMLEQAESREMQEKMARLSEINPHFRTRYISSLKGEKLISEISYELSKNPSLSFFDRAQRSRIVENWLNNGDLSSANYFLTEYGESLNNDWWLRSLYLHKQADFRAASDLIRKNIDIPDLPKIQKDQVAFMRLLRGNETKSNDTAKSTTLIYMLMGRGDYERALPIIDRLLYEDNPIPNLYYWRGECLYRLGDYDESWYAFEDYIEVL